MLWLQQQHRLPVAGGRVAGAAGAGAGQRVEHGEGGLGRQPEGQRRLQVVPQHHRLADVKVPHRHLAEGDWVGLVTVTVLYGHCDWLIDQKVMKCDWFVIGQTL